MSRAACGNWPRYAARRGGASAVELAIIAPIFLLVVLGVIEFGRMAMVQQVITNAAREGARVAVLDGATFQAIDHQVQQYLTAASIPCGTVQVLPNPPTLARYDESVSVTVTVPFDQVSWLPRPFFIKQTTLSAEAVMRREAIE